MVRKKAAELELRRNSRRIDWDYSWRPPTTVNLRKKIESEKYLKKNYFFSKKSTKIHFFAVFSGSALAARFIRTAPEGGRYVENGPKQINLVLTKNNPQKKKTGNRNYKTSLNKKTNDIGIPRMINRVLATGISRNTRFFTQTPISFLVYFWGGRLLYTR